MNEQSEEKMVSLLERARQGDKAVFDFILCEYSHRVRRLLYQFSSHHDEIEDMIQETFIAAFLRINQLNDVEQFQGWLFAIARRTALMWHRRNYVQSPLLSLDDEQEKIATSLDAVSLHRDVEKSRCDWIRHSVREAMAQLPDAQRHAVQLHYLEGYNYQETALLLHVSEPAIRGRLERARTQLRKELLPMNPVSTLAAAVCCGTTTLGAQAQELKLTKEDIQATGHASVFASQSREDIDSIFLSGEGYIVSTDTHRLFVYQAATLKGWPDTVFYAGAARSLRNDMQKIEHAHLFVHDEKGELLFQQGNLSLKLLETKYPQWKVVVPHGYSWRVVAPLKVWQDELEGMIRFWEGASPAAKHGQVPKAILTLNPATKHITIEVEQPKSDGDTSRRIRVSFPATYAAGTDNITLCSNLYYLRDAVEVFAANPSTQIELGVNEPLRPFVIRAENNHATSIITMPMTISSEDN